MDCWLWEILCYRYTDYDDHDDDPPAYRNPSYAPADRFETPDTNKDYRMSKDAYEEYSKDSSSKFDDDGAPIDEQGGPPDSSTSV